jgi:PST family polysaccharide transporter
VPHLDSNSLTKVIISRISKDILHNYVSLIIQFVAPLIILRHINSNCSSSTVGIYVLCQALLQIGCIVIDWGHSWSIGIDILSLTKKSDQSVAISKALASQLCTALVISIIAVLWCTLFLKDSGVAKAIIIFIPLSLIGYSLSPFWLFASLFKTKYTSFGTCLQRLLLIVSCVFIIDSNNSLITFLFYSGLISFGFGVYYQLIIMNFLQIDLNLKKYFHQTPIILQQDLGLFLLRIIPVVYTSAVPIIITIFSDLDSVAAYGVADRIRLSLQYSISPLSQLLQPSLEKYRLTNKIRYNKIFFLSTLVLLSLSGLISLSLAVFSPQLISIVHVSLDIKDLTINVLRTMSPIPLLICLSMLIGVNYFVPRKLLKEHFISIVCGALVGLIMMFLLISRLGAIGAAFSVLLAELIVTVMMSLLLINYKKHQKLNHNASMLS